MNLSDSPATAALAAATDLEVTRTRRRRLRLTWVVCAVLGAAVGVSGAHGVGSREMFTAPNAYQAAPAQRSPTSRVAPRAPAEVVAARPIEMTNVTPTHYGAPTNLTPVLDYGPSGYAANQVPLMNQAGPMPNPGPMPIAAAIAGPQGAPCTAGSSQSRWLWGVDCAQGNCDMNWSAAQSLPWQTFGQGEFVAHARSPFVTEYRLRVDDQLEFVFRITRDEQSKPYELNVGDEIRIDSISDATLNRDLIIQPDGSITLRLIGQVKATRHTVAELREEIERLYTKYYKIPSITVTPLKVNTKLEDLRAAVDRRQGSGGQTRTAKVTPEGTIALPAIGSVYAQGLTLDELKREIDSRYAEEVEGLEVTPVLTQRASRYVFVVGEVHTPGRYTLEGPTTVMQAITLAGGWNVGGNLRQVVVFRRGDDWRLMATLLDIRGALYGKTACPADEIWLNDSDLVVVPKAPLKVFDDYLSLIFTQGLYRIAPFNTSVNFSYLNTLTGAAAAGT